MNNRVVVTGLGVVAPNGVGITNFSEALKKELPVLSFIRNCKISIFLVRLAVFQKFLRH